MGRRKANIALLVILGAFILGAVPSTASSQPVVLKPDMPNTITLPNGEVVYDLNGEWDAVYDITVLWKGGVETQESSKDIVRITQQANHFVGIKLIGDHWISKNQEVVKGELKRNGFRKVYAFAYDLLEVRGIWVRSKGEITEDGNKIVIRGRAYALYGSFITIILKRK